MQRKRRVGTLPPTFHPPWLQRPTLPILAMEKIVGFFVVGDFEVGAVPPEGLAGTPSDVAQQAGFGQYVEMGADPPTLA